MNPSSRYKENNQINRDLRLESLLQPIPSPKRMKPPIVEHPKPDAVWDKGFGALDALVLDSYLQPISAGFLDPDLHRVPAILPIQWPFSVPEGNEALGPRDDPAYLTPQTPPNPRSGST
ncbi:hypothetical protein N7462_009144 [Penicillium macrosclerotiorum]|uniref:uncharacterized protein n=1 Tax=Penicillium macrosclerotiorum TaxID=303699 RepID=UPI002549BA7B|nr:uncharacterized protein N7462_009144 [Penicillium macrosclerotiorum]KAJ5676247.1 hypothetical protein N7462_009144 [Penicillium macrosclerotiorum]